MNNLIRPDWDVFLKQVHGYVACSCSATLKSMEEIRSHWGAGHFDYIPEEYEVVDFLWGNPLCMQEYKASKGLIKEIHNLIDIINNANNLANSCDCETCKKISEITWLPTFG